MYINAMNAPTEISITQARSELAEVIDRARMNHEPVYLMRHGQRVAAIVDSSDLARLLELAEDMNDILEAQEARNEMHETQTLPIPWESVKADLGLL